MLDGFFDIVIYSVVNHKILISSYYHFNKIKSFVFIWMNKAWKVKL